MAKKRYPAVQVDQNDPSTWPTAQGAADEAKAPKLRSSELRGHDTYLRPASEAPYSVTQSLSQSVNPNQPRSAPGRR